MMLDYDRWHLSSAKVLSIKAEEASDYIFEYMVCNDVSMRDWQMHNMPDRLS